MVEDEIPEGYTRISDILKAYTKFDALDPEMVRYAANRGQRVHSFCEAYTCLYELHAQHLFSEDEIDEDCLPYVKSFIEWFQSTVDKVHSKEVRINCDRFKISGRYDLIVSLKGDEHTKVLVDIKTPQQASKTWPLQTAAYSYLLDTISQKPERRAVLALCNKGGLPKMIEYTDLKRDECLFFKALQLYRFFN